MTRAAEALSISQPAVSRLMRDMEINLKLTLFRRRKGGLQPTEEALAFYAEVERSFVSVGKIERAAIRIRGRRGTKRKSRPSITCRWANCGRIRVAIRNRPASIIEPTNSEPEPRRWQNTGHGLHSCSAGGPRSMTYPGHLRRTCFVPSMRTDTTSR
jgi:DNA-binding transcriptional LysR family regulator